MKNINQRKKILVTVGTTQFQELVQYVDSTQFLDIIKHLDQIETQQSTLYSQKTKTNFSNFEILCQIGLKGQYLPKNFQYIRLSDKISQIYNSADFILCHGGAGTLLQNLKNNKKIIAIANDTLAGNHQIELIQKLQKQGYLLGFKNVKQLKQNTDKIKEFLQNKLTFIKYQKEENRQKCLLNNLIFNQ